MHVQHTASVTAIELLDEAVLPSHA